MKSITTRIREAYKSSKDPIDRAGIAPFYASGWWFDRAAKQHDREYIMIAAGVIDMTYEQSDDNFSKNILFDASRNPIKITQAYAMIGIVRAFTRLRRNNEAKTQR